MRLMYDANTDTYYTFDKGKKVRIQDVKPREPFRKKKPLISVEDIKKISDKLKKRD